MTHITNADYQKRGLAILHDYYNGITPDIGPEQVNDDAALQAITALCRDVCGEVIGTYARPEFDYGFMKPVDKHQNQLRAGQYETLTAILGQSQEDK